MTLPSTTARAPGSAFEDRERGAFLILWATLALALFVMVAIVIDLSQLRSIRRTSQSVTDFASLAAAAELADTSGADPVQACSDAFEYVRKNTESFPAGATMPCSELLTSVPSRVPCDNTSTPPLELRAVGASPYDVRITYPVADAQIDDPRRGGAGANDGDPCERMRVDLDRTSQAFFARVLGVDALTLGASSTARGAISIEGDDVPALLLLELEECGALQASGQGGIVAKGTGERPGIIAVDSAGTDCSSDSDNAGGRVVYGTALPSGHPDRAGEPSIEALAAEDPDPVTGVVRPPILSVWAIEAGNAGRAAAVVPSGVAPAPEGGPRVHRDPVDERYGDGIADLRSTTASYGSGFTSLRSILGPRCDVDPADPVVSEPQVLIDCDPSLGPGGEIVFTGRAFKSDRNLGIGSGQRWTFTNPDLIVVDPHRSNQPSVDIQGRLWVNTGTTTPTDTLPEGYCGSSRNGAGTSPTRLVVLSGALRSGAQSSIKLCQTTVYMADGAASPRPYNEDNADDGSVGFGAGGSTDWTAADQTDQPACSPQVPSGCYDVSDPTFALEDLALWTETAARSNIGGAGQIFLTGVFFLPNATFEFSGQALQDVDRNAQFVSRRLDMSGRGTLNLRPNPNDSITIRTGISGLIR